MLSEDQVELIRASASEIGVSYVAAGNTFYANLFRAEPSIAPLFPDDMFAQSEKLWQSVVMVVESAGNLDRVVAALRDLGARHVAYGAQPEHYVLVTEVLIRTVASFMSDRWSDAHQQAWQAALEAVCATMLDGAARSAA